jgi:hypothetical protein
MRRPKKTRTNRNGNERAIRSVPSIESTTIPDWIDTTISIVKSFLIGCALVVFWVILQMTPTWLYHMLMSAITFGSASIRDQVYANAALEPTGIVSLRLYLQLYLVMLAVLVTMFCYSIFITSVNIGKVTHRLWQIERTSLIGNDLQSQLVKSDLNWIERLVALTVVRRRSMYVKVLSISCVIVVYIGVSLYDFCVTSASAQIWRAFNSDVVKCAPFLTDIEEEVLRANYAKMKKSDDFLPILENLRTIAGANSIELASEELW